MYQKPKKYTVCPLFADEQQIIEFRSDQSEQGYIILYNVYKLYIIHTACCYELESTLCVITYLYKLVVRSWNIY